MRMLKRDFNDKSSNKTEAYYDLKEDWGLIESSVAKQYGIRLRQEKDMPWSEFCSLVSGLMSDTPLGSIIAIRAEKDMKTIRSFSPEQKRIHKDWRDKAAKKIEDDPEKLARSMEEVSIMLANLFG